MWARNRFVADAVDLGAPCGVKYHNLGRDNRGA